MRSVTTQFIIGVVVHPNFNSNRTGLEYLTLDQLANELDPINNQAQGVAFPKLHCRVFVIHATIRLWVGV